VARRVMDELDVAWEHSIVPEDRSRYLLGMSNALPAGGVPRRQTRRQG